MYVDNQVWARLLRNIGELLGKLWKVQLGSGNAVHVLSDKQRQKCLQRFVSSTPGSGCKKTSVDSYGC